MKLGASSLHSSQLLVLQHAQESSCLCFHLPWFWLESAGRGPCSVLILLLHRPNLCCKQSRAAAQAEIVTLLDAGSRDPGSIAPEERRECEVMTRVAAATAECMRCLQSTQQVSDCLTAIMSGDLCPPSSLEPEGEVPAPAGGGAPGAEGQAQLLPLQHPFIPLSTTEGQPQVEQAPWVATLLTALLHRACDLGLQHLVNRLAGDQPDSPGTVWRTLICAFFGMLVGHLGALFRLRQQALDAEDAPAAAYARAIVPVDLIRAALPHADESQREQLREFIVQLN